MAFAPAHETVLFPGMPSDISHESDLCLIVSFVGCLHSTPPLNTPVVAAGFIP